jgi:hypothetical protein
MSLASGIKACTVGHDISALGANIGQTNILGLALEAFDHVGFNV